MEEMGLAEGQTMENLKALVKEGAAERVPGRKLSAAGVLIPCTYYRLIKNK